MPENELAIPYTEVKKLVKQYGNRQTVNRLDHAIDNDLTGIMFAYRKGCIAFEIKRYKTGRFIKKSY